jgi:hypothetical protein
MTVLLGAEGVEVVREAPGTVVGEALDALEQALTEERRGPVAHPAAGAAVDQPQTAPSREGTGTSADQKRAVLRWRRQARAKAAGLGRSRGGLSSKIHAAVDAGGLPRAFVLTPGQAAGCPRFQAVCTASGSPHGYEAGLHLRAAIM